MSTRPPCTATSGRSAGRSATAGSRARRCSSPPSCRRAPPAGSGAPSTTACGPWGPTTWTCGWSTGRRAAGLARAVGVSNYGIGELDQVTRATGQAPQVNQIPWAPALYDAALLAQHRERGVVLEGYSPFKNTDLRHPVLTETAADHSVTPAQVVVRWHVDHEVVVIPKSVTPERIAANFDVFGFSLTEEELRRIDGLSGSRRR